MFHLIVQLLYIVLKPLIAIFDIAPVPPEMVAITNQVLSYINSGMGIFNYFLPLNSLYWAVDIWLLIWGVHHAYLCAMWVYRKIPMLGIN